MKNPIYFEIPYEEYKSRMDKIKELMEANHLDAVLLLSPENIGYYSGYRGTWIATHQEYGVIIPKEKNPIIFIPWLVSQTVNKTTWIEEVRTWSGAKILGHPEGIVEVVTQVIKDMKLDQKKVVGAELGGGMYMNISYNDFQAIINKFPNTRFVDISSMIWGQRKVKSPFEIQIIRKLADITIKGLKEGIESIKPGMTERQLSENIWHAWISEGAFDSPMQGQSLMRTGRGKEGPSGRYNCVCTRPIDFPIEYGEMVFFDGGPSYKGYMADIQRMVSVGKPSDILKKLVNTAESGYKDAISILKPGTKISEVYKAAVDGMEKVIPGARDKYPLSFVGHSIGLNIHEPPWITANENSLLEGGMVITVEVGAYDMPSYRTLGGFPEDMFLITKDGSENLTGALSRDLWEVG